MTEYEAISIFYELANMSNNQLLGYVSILSAFLIMSYFAADKLSKALMIIVLVLFSFVSILLIIQINMVRNDMRSLHTYVLELRDAGGEGLMWFGENPSLFVENISVVLNFVTIGGFIGCLVFFFYKKNQKNIG